MTVVETRASVSLLDLPHHDGSGSYLVERPLRLGDEAIVRLRVPLGTEVDAVAVRYLRDGEPRAVRAELVEETEADRWWRATFPVHNPSVPYRWLLSGGELGYAWVNGLGLVLHDPPDSDDFVVSLDPGGPDWHLRSVVYEVFPDRFARGAHRQAQPDWAVAREWDELPAGRAPQTPLEWYGGDLAGIEERLDHLEALGATTLYLTPFFPARSSHRYDASSFERVDPHLGGDDALASLVAAAHARGIRVLGDLTLNHSGDAHEWFLAARGDAEGPERDYYFLDDELPLGYEAWLGVRTLPKLDHRSAALRRRLVSDPGSPVRRWLRAPFELDGWRIDVANMAGRFRDVDSAAELARDVRAAIAAERKDAVVIAEHAHDARGDLRGGGWHGTMGYAGFLRPVWAWLRGDELPDDLATGFLGLPVGLPRIRGEQLVATMRAFRAGVPWSSVLHSWTLLDSHDTARFATVAGSRERHLVGVGLQMTTPGVPMVFAGDELGLEGAWGEDARRTIPWDAPERWDSVLFEGYARLIELRRSSDALALGGIRYAHVGADAVAYLRETASERLLCLAARAEHEPVRLPLAALDARSYRRCTAPTRSSPRARRCSQLRGPHSMSGDSRDRTGGLMCT